MYNMKLLTHNQSILPYKEVIVFKIVRQKQHYNGIYSCTRTLSNYFISFKNNVKNNIQQQHL